VQKIKQQANNVAPFSINNQIFELPKIEERKRVSSRQGAKIINRGADNKLPYFLAEIVGNSSTLKSVINSKADYVSYGDVVSDNQLFLDKLKFDLNKDYDFSELSRRVSKDKFTFGYAFIQEVRVGAESYCYHVDASTVAIEDYKEGEKPLNVWISEDWNDTKYKPYEVALYPNYSNVDGKKTRIIPLFDYSPASKDYPRPQWSGAIYDAQVESFIGQYNANQFENGITLSSILMFDFGHVVPTEKETPEDAMLRQRTKLESQLKGTTGQRSGKSLVVPKSGGVDKPEYITYPMEKEGSYLELQKLIENNIVKANSWFRSLAGLESAGTLGNNQQVKNEWELAERLITNIQHDIMNAYLKTLEGTPFEDIEYSFNNTSPFNAQHDFASLILLAEKLNTKVISIEQSKALFEMMGISENQVQKLIQ